MINDAASYGVTVEVAALEQGAKWRWECVRVHHLTPAENSGNHNLYVNLLQEDGQRARSRTAWVSWPGDNEMSLNVGCIAQDKPDAEPGGNMPVWKGQVVACGVNTDYREISDRVVGIHTGHPDEAPAVPGGDKGNTLYHHSFLVEFRRVSLTTSPGEGNPPTPDVPPAEPPADDGGGVDVDPSLPPTVPEKYWGWREQIGQEVSIRLYRVAALVNQDGARGSPAVKALDELVARLLAVHGAVNERSKV